MSAALAARIAALDWPALQSRVRQMGFAATGALLTQEECAGLRGCYGEDGLFRSTIVMTRHGFGQGEYRYFRYALPPLVQTLRASLYRALLPVARSWATTLATQAVFPDTHEDYIRACHAAGQCRPTPLLLKYGPGDYNCLHQDLYGAQVFPLQCAFLLSDPARDFTGGAFVLTEQRPRMQSRAEVVDLTLGEAVIFAVHHRPVQGARGPYRVNMRHGVSRLHGGERFTLGVIFHDAA